MYCAWFTESKSVCWETTKVSKVVFSSLFFLSPYNGQTIATATRSRRTSCQFPAQTNALQRVRHFFSFFFTFWDVGSSPSLVQEAFFLFSSFWMLLGFFLFLFYFLLCFIICFMNLTVYVVVGNLFLFLVFIFWKNFMSAKFIFMYN